MRCGCSACRRPDRHGGGRPPARHQLPCSASRQVRGGSTWVNSGLRSASCRLPRLRTPRVSVSAGPAGVRADVRALQRVGRHGHGGGAHRTGGQQLGAGVGQIPARTPGAVPGVQPQAGAGAGAPLQALALAVAGIQRGGGQPQRGPARQRLGPVQLQPGDPRPGLVGVGIGADARHRTGRHQAQLDQVTHTLAEGHQLHLARAVGMGHGQLQAVGHLGLQAGVADHGVGPFGARARGRLLQVGGAEAMAVATLHRPAGCRPPDEVGTRAPVVAEQAVVVQPQAGGQRPAGGWRPGVLHEQRVVAG
jgi:hypothetical protein